MPDPVVLIAEDNEINQLVARAMLRKEGVGSAIAHDGGEAVEMASATDYAAILMDCQMPELDGYEATRQIRARERSGRVPIIAMTAHSLPSDRDRCLAAGMDDYISKPVARQRLHEVISRWLSDGGGLQGRAPGAERPGPDGSAPEVDAATCASLREEHPLEMRQSLVETFELQLPSAVQEILEAARQGDAARLKRAAHRLRGSSLMLGASSLASACQSMEDRAQPGSAAIDSAQEARLQAIADAAVMVLRRQLL